MLLRTILLFSISLPLFSFGAPVAAPPSTILLLQNRHVLRELHFKDGRWKTVRFAALDGSHALPVQSDEFHILLMNDHAYTVDDYEAVGAPETMVDGAIKKIRITYRPDARHQQTSGMPQRVVVEYTLADEPYIRKQVSLELRDGDVIDRLEVERFSVTVPAERGGRGEPVFVDEHWFFGVEYPAFYARHTDGNTPSAYSGLYDRLGNYSFIDLEGRDVDPQARSGLIRLMHFPGYARALGNSRWGIVSKTAVAGLNPTTGSMEQAFIDYLDTIRRPVRSFIHYNNWYDGSGKNLSIDNFVNRTFLAFKRNLDPYGVHIDAMVPDNGWQNGQSVYQPSSRHFPKGMEDFARLGQALGDEGSHLGLWMALNGYNSRIDWGRANGYAEAVRNPHFSRFKRYYCIVAPAYREALEKQLAALINEGDIQYIKHDFNEMCCLGEGHGHLPTDRHGHEASVDVELALLALEREVQPRIYQNITNWIWFSPWWLMHGNNLWMLAGDSGVNRKWPQLSTRKMAITYRDAHLHRAWGDPATRPLVPISHLMTHGIIFADRQRVEQQTDSLRDWSDYVVMYYARGLQLKEWYITPTLMDDDRWRVLGQATRWSEENVELLANTVMIGGRPDHGEGYGFVCWRENRGLVTLRNPDVKEQTIEVPFDRTVLFRGPAGKPFRAHVVYPYQDEWPEALFSGRPMRITVPGYSTMVMEVEPGTPTPSDRTTLPPPPAPQSLVKNGSGISFELPLPDEDMKRCDMLLVHHGSEPTLLCNGKQVEPTRRNQGPGWFMVGFDLSGFSGTRVKVALTGASEKGGIFPRESGKISATLVMDRPMPSRPVKNDVTRPWALGHGFRRQTVELLPELAFSFGGAPPGSISERDLENIKAAKLRLWLFGSDGGRYAGKEIRLNDRTLAKVPINNQHDYWEEFILDVPPKMLQHLQRRNSAVLTNPAEDRFKFKGLVLGVQKPDGSWVVSAGNVDTQASHEDWAHAEGTSFPEGSLSKPLRLPLP